MINNLRYHLDGNNILVRWNYVEIRPNTTVTCMLCRRISGEKIEQHDQRNHSNITLETYKHNGGGDIFSMPDCPVKIVVFENDNPQDTRQEVIVRESPQHFIQAHIAVNDDYVTEKRGRGFLKSTESIHHRSMSMSLTFPNTCTAGEIDALNEVGRWPISGVFVQNGGKPDRFFWPEEFNAGENRLSAFEIPAEPSISGSDFHFEIPDEVKGDPRFENVFTFDRVEHKRDNDARPIEEIDLLALKPRDETGHYPITCPYCLETFRFDEPLFRAMIMEGEDYAGRPDQVYADAEDRIAGKKNMASAKLGRILDWKQDIREYTLASDPGVFYLYEPGEVFTDVVVGVRDSNGNLFYNKVCPRCHHSIPAYSGYYPSIFLNMMGNTGSGKTVFMSRMIQMLFRRKLLPGYQMECLSNMDMNSKAYEKKFDELMGDLKYHSRNQMPAAAVSAPVSAVGAPVAPVGTPVTPVGTPVAPVGTPAAAVSAPVSAVGAPFAPVGAPFAPVGTPAATVGTPAATVSAPVSAVGAPGAPVGMPVASVGTPVVPIGMPGIAPGVSMPDAAAPAKASEASGTPAVESAVSTGVVDESIASRFKQLMNRKAPAQPNVKVEEDSQRLLDPTPLSSFPEPCTYQLRSADGKNGLIISFFDFPGEFIWPNGNSESQAQHRYYPYFKRLLEKVHGMVFLFDPMTIQYVINLGAKRQLEFSKQTYVSEEEQMRDLLSQTPRDILSAFKQKFCPVSRLPIPVVFAISKSDAIRDYLALQDDTIAMDSLRFLDESANGASSQRRGIDLEEINDNSLAILKFMQDEDLRIRSGELSDDYIWMCISALGIAPKDGTMKGRYGNPVRMMDPIEWILYKIQEYQRQTAND